MRIIYFILQKEFRQIFRNRSMLPIIFVMPVVQLLILAHAATFEATNIRLKIVDRDHSPESRRLAGKFAASDYFITDVSPHTVAEAQEAMQRGEADMILEVPPHFGRDLVKEQGASLLLSIDVIDGAAAGVYAVYANAIIRDLNTQLRLETAPAPPHSADAPARLLVSPLFWFNPQLDYKTFMVPGILVLLVTMVAIFLAGMNIVREKEIGTLEQLNVTPIRRYQFIVGKLLPFWLLGLFELAAGLLLAKLVFDIPYLGSLWTVFMFAAIYLPVVLGMGFFISNFTNTQQQAMFLSWFFMVIFILMSGLFTPIESMPAWARAITEFNPIRYFVEVMRMVLLKGAGPEDIWPQLLKTGAYAVVMNTLAIISYRKTT